MLESNKDRLMWAILGVVVAVAVGVLIQEMFPEIIGMIGDVFRAQIGAGS